MLLAPSEPVNELVLYVLAVAAERFEILVHAVCVLSNHLHVVLTDPRGRLPEFEQYSGALIARSCNALRGRWESFWAPGSYSAVRLLEERDVIDKIAYTLANPVSAGLVRHGAEWPGLRTTPASFGKRLVARRPDVFFRINGDMPATASLRVVAPPGVESIEDFRRAIRNEVQRQEDESAERIMAAGRTFLGVAAVRAQSFTAAPTSSEPRRRLNPRIACLDRDKRKRALEKLKEFARAYREAWRDFADGLRDTVFPHGTYWMRVAYGVGCVPAG